MRRLRIHTLRLAVVALMLLASVSAADSPLVNSEAAEAKATSSVIAQAQNATATVHSPPLISSSAPLANEGDPKRIHAESDTPLATDCNHSQPSIPPAVETRAVPSVTAVSDAPPVSAKLSVAPPSMAPAVVAAVPPPAPPPPPAEAAPAALDPKSIFSTNYASSYLGAKVVEAHRDAKGAGNVLKENKESYLNIPCRAERKFFTVQLSRTIEVNLLAINNLEYFSSFVKNFTVLGSRSFPCLPPSCMWRVLGSFQGKAVRQTQLFQIARQPSVRFLRFLWVSHHGREKSCTLTTLQVYGTDALENFAADFGVGSAIGSRHHHHHSGHAIGGGGGGGGSAAPPHGGAGTAADQRRPLAFDSLSEFFGYALDEDGGLYVDSVAYQQQQQQQQQQNAATVPATPPPPAPVFVPLNFTDLRLKVIAEGARSHAARVAAAEARRRALVAAEEGKTPKCAAAITAADANIATNGAVCRSLASAGVLASPFEASRHVRWVEARGGNDDESLDVDVITNEPTNFGLSVDPPLAGAADLFVGSLALNNPYGIPLVSSSPAAPWPQILNVTQWLPPNATVRCRNVTGRPLPYGRWATGGARRAWQMAQDLRANITAMQGSPATGSPPPLSPSWRALAALPLSVVCLPGEEGAERYNADGRGAVCAVEWGYLAAPAAPNTTTCGSNGGAGSSAPASNQNQKGAQRQPTGKPPVNGGAFAPSAAVAAARHAPLLGTYYKALNWLFREARYLHSAADGLRHGVANASAAAELAGAEGRALNATVAKDVAATKKALEEHVHSLYATINELTMGIEDLRRRSESQQLMLVVWCAVSSAFGLIALLCAILRPPLQSTAARVAAAASAVGGAARGGSDSSGGISGGSTAQPPEGDGDIGVLSPRLDDILASPPTASASDSAGNQPRAEAEGGREDEDRQHKPFCGDQQRRRGSGSGSCTMLGEGCGIAEEGAVSSQSSSGGAEAEMECSYATAAGDGCALHSGTHAVSSLLSPITPEEDPRHCSGGGPYAPDGSAAEGHGGNNERGEREDHDGAGHHTPLGSDGAANDTQRYADSGSAEEGGETVISPPVVTPFDKEAHSERHCDEDGSCGHEGYAEEPAMEEAYAGNLAAFPPRDAIQAADEGGPLSPEETYTHERARHRLLGELTDDARASARDLADLLDRSHRTM